MKFKNFASKISAQRAIAKQGLTGFPHTIQPEIHKNVQMFVPHFYPDISEDFHDLRHRGFYAEYNAKARAVFEMNRV